MSRRRELRLHSGKPAESPPMHRGVRVPTVGITSCTDGTVDDGAIQVVSTSG